MTDRAEIRTALLEMQGLIHEAMSNVELDRGLGQTLNAEIATALKTLETDVLPADALGRLLAQVRSGVEGPASREREKDNPIAAVHRVEEIIAELGG